jgi:hypothetical protein
MGGGYLFLPGYSSLYDAIHGWMTGQMDGWMDGWMDGSCEKTSQKTTTTSFTICGMGNMDFQIDPPKNGFSPSHHSHHFTL